MFIPNVLNKSNKILNTLSYKPFFYTNRWIDILVLKNFIIILICTYDNKKYYADMPRHQLSAPISVRFARCIRRVSQHSYHAESTFRTAILALSIITPQNLNTRLEGRPLTPPFLVQSAYPRVLRKEYTKKICQHIIF